MDDTKAKTAAERYEAGTSMKDGLVSWPRAST